MHIKAPLATILVFLGLFITGAVAAETLSFSVARAEGPIRIDGVIDEAAWDAAAVIPLDYEYQPGDNIPAVVSTDVTGIPEVLEDGLTGLAVPQRDSSALAAACLRLLEDAGLRKNLSVNARQLIEDRFDIRQNSRELRDLFSRILRDASS